MLICVCFGGSRDEERLGKLCPVSSPWVKSPGRETAGVAGKEKWVPQCWGLLRRKTGRERAGWMAAG